MVGENSPRRVDGPSRRVARPRNVLSRDYSDGATASDFGRGQKNPMPGIVRPSRPHSSRLWVKRGAIGIASFSVLVVGIIGFKFIAAGQKIITPNVGAGAPALAGEVDPTKLKGEGDGRINVLLLGVGGPGHEAPNLSDTIIVASIDPRTKEVAMLSIPRDLYVKIPGYGSTKINAANAYGEDVKTPGRGAALAKKTVSEILDIPIHYYVRADFAGFKQAVDAVGGVDVSVKKPIYDPEYPCDRGGGYCPLNIAAGKQHMNSALALKYARSRKGTGGGDFDRAARQQEILVALRQKAQGLSTITNPAKIISLMDAAGNHVSTDMQVAEIKKMAELIKDIDMSKAISRVLDTSPQGLLEFGNIPGAGSIVVPRAGLYNYSEIRELVHSIFTDSYLRDEGAKLEILNGTTRDGLASAAASSLRGYSYNIASVATADRQDYPKTVIYDYTDGKKPFTIRYLEKRFNVVAQKAHSSDTQGSQIDVRIILGSDYRANISQQ